MCGTKCWEQNFDFLNFIDFTDQNMSKKWLFWDFLDFWAPKIEKKKKKGEILKSISDISSNRFPSGF